MNLPPGPAHTRLKLGLLASLYFSQGLPLGFFSQAVPVMLRKGGFSLSQIGLTSLLAMPWALKFLWAPLVDRYSLPNVGRRKSWIVPLQAAAVVTLGVVAVTRANEHFGLLLASVFVLNLIAATQDIATDGYAVEMLTPKERGFGNGVQVAGYRVGMIVGGGALLIVFDKLGASLTFAAMAAMVALMTLPVLVTKEPPTRRAVEGSSSRALRQFFKRPGVGAILLLIVVYKVGDAFATGMLRPLLADLDLGLAEIGWLLGTVGFVAGLLGALCGGALVNRLGRKRALISFGMLQAATAASYAIPASMPVAKGWLYTICGVEHFCGGMATAALFTCMMDWCSKENAATDYTIQASAVVIATGTAAMLSGFSAQALGYVGHFVPAGLLAMVSLWFVARFFPNVALGERESVVSKEVSQCA
jgi:MFS family permease